MRDEIDPELTKLAAAMRKSPTEAERRLWWALRHALALKGAHFRRRVVIERAIVDFACIAAGTIVEVDGDRHGHDLALAHHARRTQASRIPPLTPPRQDEDGNARALIPLRVHRGECCGLAEDYFDIFLRKRESCATLFLKRQHTGL